MMKNKVPIILILVSIIFFNTVNVTCAFKDSGNTNVEMIVTAKCSPVIQTLYWTVQQFFHQENPIQQLNKENILPNNEVRNFVPLKSLSLKNSDKNFINTIYAIATTTLIVIITIHHNKFPSFIASFY